MKYFDKLSEASRQTKLRVFKYWKTFTVEIEPFMAQIYSQQIYYFNNSDLAVLSVNYLRKVVQELRDRCLV